jgi:hypothetical protein
MKIAQASTVGLLGAALLVGTAAVGCSSDDKGSSSSSSSSSTSAAATTSATASETTSASASPSAQGADYSNLLLKPTDIDPSFTATTAPILNPNGVPGVGQALTNPGHNETIYFTIAVLDSPDKTGPELEGLKQALASKVTGAPQPADVGTGGGTIATGTSPDGSKAVTEVFFAEGKAVVNIEFESAPNDPVQPETALAIAKMQDTQVKNGLPS